MVKKPTEKKEKKERPAIVAKKAQVVEISKLVKKFPTLAVVNLRNLPDSLLQSSRKKLREADGTEVKVAKLAVVKRVLANAGLKEQAEAIANPSALFLTTKSPYELNKFFRDNKKRVAAKPGQASPDEIVVPASDTDIPPGPALSELKNAGLTVQIKAGKIAVIKDSVIAKKGETITLAKAKALQMLGIRPFEVGVNLAFAYDGKYIYSPDVLSISLETLVPDLSAGIRDALNVSINAGYPSEMSSEILLSEAYLQGLNVGINSGAYTSGTIERLLMSATLQGMAVSAIEKK
jgi:large subunit ribosomal protein L10